MGWGWMVAFMVALIILSLYYFLFVYPYRRADGGLNPFASVLGSRLLTGLPAIYYFLAVFCGIVLFGYTAYMAYTVVNMDELDFAQKGAVIGGWIGGSVGTVLSMLTIGWVIQLLQQIRDAVRS
ncbi:MAG: hypothetical protein VX738_00540 [Planctomycetota bacterium]|nr:hypothetical protein [Planctomycetota bacterium]